MKEAWFWWLLPLLGLLAFALSAEVNVTGFNPTTFSSCEVSQFKITGAELDGGRCIFTNFNGDEFSFDGSLVDQDLLCLFNISLPPDVYAVSVLKNDLSFPAPFNLTVTPSPLSPNETEFIPFSTSYAAGQEIIFEIFPLSSCLTSSICDSSNPDDFTFSFTFDDPSISVSYLGKSGGNCQYQVSPITKKGNYTLTVHIQNSNSSTLFVDPSPSFSIVAGISSVNQSLTDIDTSSLSPVVAGVQACMNITLYDSYNNTVNKVTASKFALSWVGSSESPAKTLLGERDGVYTLCFLPTKGGARQLEVRVNNVVLRGSPIAMTVLPGAFNPTSSLLRASSPSCPPSCDPSTPSVSAVAGIPVSFVIVPKDQYQNQKTTTDDVSLDSFSALIVGAGGSTISNGTLARHSSGAFLEVEWTVEESGTFKVNVTYSNASLPLDAGSIPALVVSPAPPSMASSSFNTSLLAVVAGSPFAVPFTARDLYGNLASGFSPLLWHASVNSSTPSACTVAESSPGIYTATCAVNETGAFSLSFVYDSTPFPQSKPIHVAPAVVSAATSFFADFPASLPANTSGTLTIHVRDLYGNVGGTLLSFHHFQVQLQLKQGSRVIEVFSTQTLTHVDEGGEALMATFAMRAAGTYVITVQLNGAALGVGEGLAPSLVVLPGPTQGSRCTLALLSPPVAALPFFLLLEARDAFANIQVLDQLALFAVNATLLSDPSRGISCPIALTSSPGVYNVTCLPSLMGRYSVVGFFQGQAAFTTTEQVEVVPGAITMATTVFDSSSTGQRLATAGKEAHVLIQGRDAAGNPISYAEDFDVILTPQGPGRRRGDSDVTPIVATKVVDDVHATGGISVYSYNTSLAGPYLLSVRRNGSDISGSPAHLVVAPAPADVTSISFDFSTSPSPSLPLQAHVGQNISLTLSLKDLYGNLVGDADSFSASLIADTAVTQTQPQYIGNGRYQLLFQPSSGGLYALTLVINDVIVPQNMTVEVLSEVGGECTEFEGNLNQGQKWELVCKAFDKYGKEKLEGGDHVDYEADHGTVEVKDHGDGRYTATYSSQAIGRRNLTLFISGRSVAKMPYRPVIIPGAVVLGTVIPAIFVLALLVVAAGYSLHQRKLKQQQLQSRKRKPQQIFKPGDEGEWSDDEGQQHLVPNDELEEQWFTNLADGNEKIRRAHSLAMFELEGN